MKIIYFLSLILASLLFGFCNAEAAESKLIPQYAPVAGGQIEYYAFGKGSPIVLIPGYGTDVTGWSSRFLKALADHHQLIVLNNRNVGGSCIDSRQYHSSDLANDVFELMQHLQLKKPALLGISMGGMIAQQVAALHPQDLAHLILINTAISGHQSVHPSPRMERKILNIPHNPLGFYWVAVHSFFPSSWKIKMAFSLIFDRFLPKKYTGVRLRQIVPYQRELILDWAQDEVTAKKITKLPMPVLILNGNADAVIPPINSNILAQAIPHDQLIHWKDGGHAMIYQYPMQLAQCIDEFIRKDSLQTPVNGLSMF